MSDWPTPTTPAAITIHTYSPESLGDVYALMGMAAPVSAVWPAANRALYIPFTVGQPLVVTQLFLWNGSAVSGNVDMGIYDVAGTRIVSIGPAAQAGTSVLQAFDITDTLLGVGAFYLAVLVDNTTATTFRTVSPASVAGAALYGAGLREQAVGSGTLPATATFGSTITSNYVPNGGLTTRTVV